LITASFKDERRGIGFKTLISPIIKIVLQYYDLNIRKPGK
jgi:hypothetical protein